jgi:hypothetical protein
LRASFSNEVVTHDDEAELARVESMLRAAGVRVLRKLDAWHQRALDRLLRIVSFGQATRYATRYVTTIGRAIYVPEDWASRPAHVRAEILRHELVHVRQFARWGIVPMSLAYLLFPLPVGLAWCRAALEKEAYAESLRAAFERDGAAGARAMKSDIVGRFTGPDYLWMWPFPRAVAAWVDRVIDELDHHA